MEEINEKRLEEIKEKMLQGSNESRWCLEHLPNDIIWSEFGVCAIEYEINEIAKEVKEEFLFNQMVGEMEKRIERSSERIQREIEKEKKEREERYGKAKSGQSA